MYPKVRVRVEDDDAAAEDQLHFEKFNSIPVESSDPYSKAPEAHYTGDQCRGYCQQSDVTVPRSYPTLTVCLTISDTCIEKGNKDQQVTLENKTKDNQENCDDSKPNIRASLVPRPRAVLSSPVNDGMIGCKNQVSKGAAIRKNEHGHNSYLQGKLNPKIVQPRTETTTVRKTRASPSVISQFSTVREAGPSATLVRHPDQKKFVSDPKAKKQGTYTGKAKNIV